MKSITVVLPRPTEGRELLNLITEVTQEILGEVLIKGEPEDCYLYDTARGLMQKTFPGSKVTIDFTARLVYPTQRWFRDGYKINRENLDFRIATNTVLVSGYNYSAVEFYVLEKQIYEHNETRFVDINLNQEKYASLQELIERLVGALYQKLVPETKKRPIKDLVPLVS